MNLKNSTGVITCTKSENIFICSLVVLFKRKGSETFTILESKEASCEAFALESQKNTHYSVIINKNDVKIIESAENKLFLIPLAVSYQVLLALFQIKTKEIMSEIDFITFSQCCSLRPDSNSFVQTKSFTGKNIKIDNYAISTLNTFQDSLGCNSITMTVIVPPTVSYYSYSEFKLKKIKTERIIKFRRVKQSFKKKFILMKKRKVT
jgi:hypothetical protein